MEWGAGWRRSTVILIYSLLIPVALVLPRNMAFLATASTASFIVLGIYVYVMIYKGAVQFGTVGIDPTAVAVVLGWRSINALSIFIVTFAIPSVILPLMQNFDRDLKKRFRVVGASFVGCWIIVVVPSVIGYLMFGRGSAQDILNSFGSKDLMIEFARGAFFLVLNASYPVIGYVMSCDLSAGMFEVPDSVDLPNVKRGIVLMITNVPVILVAMLMPDMRPVLEIGGSLGGCLCNFVYPPPFWLLVKEGRGFGTGFAIIFLMFGVFIAFFASYQAVLDAGRCLGFSPDF
jgi:uncharacterized membrane protein YozB (DUF420 family)